MAIVVLDKKESASFERHSPPIYAGNPYSAEHDEPLIRCTVAVLRASFGIAGGNAHGRNLCSCVR